MNEAINRNIFLVKEHVGILKAANNYDIHDVETGDIVMECREKSLGLITKLLRFTGYKRYTPFDIRIKTPDGRQVVRITRGVSIFVSKAQVFDEKDNFIGGFFSLGAALSVLDVDDNPVCMLEGKLTGWDFKFTDGVHEYAHVTKKWSGIGQELFTSVDNYVFEISESVPKNDKIRQLIMAAVMCVNIVLKE